MFFPIGDDNRARTRVPYVTRALVALNVLVFLFELAVDGQGQLQRLVQTWGVVPAGYSGAAAVGGPVPWTLLTAMFLHGGWGHILGNMVYLAIFGDNVEDAFGHGRFLAFYLVCGVVASLAHILSAPASVVPSLGASGAISGVLAAYLLMFPRNAVLVVIWFTVRALPALLVIGLWAVVQLVSGAGSIVRTSDSGGVAYLAHVGGFACGLLLTAFLRPRAAHAVPPRG